MGRFIPDQTLDSRDKDFSTGKDEGKGLDVGYFCLNSGASTPAHISLPSQLCFRAIREIREIRGSIPSALSALLCVSARDLPSPSHPNLIRHPPQPQIPNPRPHLHMLHPQRRRGVRPARTVQWCDVQREWIIKRFDLSEPPPCAFAALRLRVEPRANLDSQSSKLNPRFA
jgi:hypothetical protein